MNSFERTRRSIRDEAVDRLPCFPILIAPSCQLLGVRQSDYNLKPEVMVDTLIRARELTGFDGIYLSRDNWVARMTPLENLRAMVKACSDYGERY